MQPLKLLRLRLSAQLETRREAGRALFGFDAGSCPVFSGSSGVDLDEFASAITAGMQSVEPYRRWAATLPLVWQLRLDVQLSLLAHFGQGPVARQLRSDVADLLNGEEHPSAMDPDARQRFLVYLSVLLHTPRYQQDPELATLTETALAAAMDLALSTSEETAGATRLLDAATGRVPFALSA